MSSPQTAPETRSYGCTFGCGNPFDVVVIMVGDSTTEFLCIPCWVKMAADVLEAMNNADNPVVKAAMEYAAANPLESTPGPTGKSRGHNAPATETDPDLIETFNDVITADELPEEFR